MPAAWGAPLLGHAPRPAARPRPPLPPAGPRSWAWRASSPSSWRQPVGAVGRGRRADPTLRLATGIALAFTRSPFETALAALDLDHLSRAASRWAWAPACAGGTRHFYGVAYDRPVARLAEATRIIKAVVSGQARTARAASTASSGSSTSAAWPMKPPLRPDLPVWVAALRTPLVRVAGEVADGLIGHPSWSLALGTEAAHGHVRRGAGRLGPGPLRRRGQPVARGRPQPRRGRVGARRQAPRSLLRGDRRSTSRTSPPTASGPRPAGCRRPSPPATRGIADLVPDDMARDLRRVRHARRRRPPAGAAVGGADSMCLQPPPVRGEARAAYEQRIAEPFSA